MVMQNFVKNRRWGLIVFAIFLVLMVLRFVHVDAVNDDLSFKTEACRSQSNGPTCATLERVAANYDRDVRAIFESKCMDCHGAVKTLPLYSRIPGVARVLSDHRRDGRRLWEISQGFPFGGEKTLLDQLDEIEVVLTQGEMPPIEYLVMHWNARVSSNDLEKILHWVHESYPILESEIETKSETEPKKP